jgi:hypothetical protein
MTVVTILADVQYTVFIYAANPNLDVSNTSTKDTQEFKKETLVELVIMVVLLEQHRYNQKATQKQPKNYPKSIPTSNV